MKETLGLQVSERVPKDIAIGKEIGEEFFLQEGGG